MKRFFLLLWLSLAAGLSPARAEGPGDQYIRIYGLIQAGDKLATGNDASAALPKYAEAQSALQQFQKIYPDWNTKVVNFRLDYLNAKILAITANAPAEAAPVSAPAPAPMPAPSTKPAPVEPTPAVPTDVERKLTALQADLRQSQADKSILEAKLKEALAAQPAALDPRELTKAQEQIQELRKENELLKASAPADQTKPSPTSTAKTRDETRRALADANRKLKEQTSRADALAAEKKILERRLESVARAPDETAKLKEARQALEAANRELAAQTELNRKLTSEKNTLQTQVKTLAANSKAAIAPPSSDPETARKLAAAETRIAALQSDAEILRLEKAALETRVQTLARSTPAAAPQSSTNLATESRPADLARIKLLENERDELTRRLAVANKELSGRKSRAAANQIASLDNQIAALRARLAIFEARAVPYTAEELALFKTAAPQLAAAAPNAGKKSIKALPGGTAGFVASAQRHFAAKEYDQAEADYLEILRRDENNAYTLANLAAIQLERGNLAEAEKNVTKALAGAPDDAYALSILGQVKFRQEQYDAALDALSRAATANPQSAEIQNYLGVALSHKGLRVPAETALRRAIVLQPNHAGAHNNLAVIYARQQPPALELARWHYAKARAAGHPPNEELEKKLNEKPAPP